MKKIILAVLFMTTAFVSAQVDLITKHSGEVVKGKVIKKKQSIGKKMRGMIDGDESADVGSYIVYDVLLPAFKNTLAEMVSGGIEMLLFGERRGSRTDRNRGKSYVSYNTASKQQRPEPSQRNRSLHNFEEIVLESRGEAEEVLSRLVDLVDEYGQVSVADLYDLVGTTSNFTDNKYGWLNLGRATVSRVRGGYLIDLPKTVVLD